ncbi:Fur family iron response transcriptional regulator [Stella humosa]|uniref:Ferric uptake regulation protein n=1 Tax=Stella humosa TaxID=94 RepID=A0A3N1KZX8_9PROT|nr:Fur family transcriptional regulator [Stella humosa]ROP84339.1 Fur family iron response transcriptional regulator [Stella humosa]BBK33853.1 transcriptional repressor [Stella humosa]
MSQVTHNRPFAAALERLRASELRPTRQRLALARLLFEGEDRHVTAEQVHAEAAHGGIRVSLATVYNTLHQFTRAGMMREVVVEAGRSYFDTNVSDHHHLFFEENGRLVDVPAAQIAIAGLPDLPEGVEVSRIDVILRASTKSK